MSVLVTYTSMRGSTRDIAQRIAARLQQHSLQVDCHPMADITSATLAKYTHILLGSAIHNEDWVDGANKFLSDNKATLRSKEVWAFSVGMPGTEEYRLKEEGMMERKLKGTLLEMRGHKLFLGRLYRRHVQLPMLFFVSCCLPKEMIKWGDGVDGSAVDRWADAVGREVK